MPNFIGTPGNDALIGTDGADSIDGLAGDDVITGTFGTDSLFGGEGDDTFVFQTARQLTPPDPPSGVIDGGSGYDTLDLSQFSTASFPAAYFSYSGVLRVHFRSESYEVRNIERILLGAGNDFVGIPSLYAQSVDLQAGAGDDHVFGGRGSDRIWGDAGNDTIDGSDGGDRIWGGAGNDVIGGGNGNDTAVFTGPRSDYTITKNGGGYSILGPDGVDALTEVEFAEFSDHISILKGNFIQGTAADDNLVGTEGADNLEGFAGNDVISGGNGDDIIVGSGGSDIMRGGLGVDAFYIAPGDLAEGELIDGGSESDQDGSFGYVNGAFLSDGIWLSGGGVFDFRSVNVTNITTLAFEVLGDTTIYLKDAMYKSPQLNIFGISAGYAASSLTVDSSSMSSSQQISIGFHFLAKQHSLVAMEWNMLARTWVARHLRAWACL